MRIQNTNTNANFGIRMTEAGLKYMLEYSTPTMVAELLASGNDQFELQVGHCMTHDGAYPRAELKFVEHDVSIPINDDSSAEDINRSMECLALRALDSAAKKGKLQEVADKIKKDCPFISAKAVDTRAEKLKPLDEYIKTNKPNLGKTNKPNLGKPKLESGKKARTPKKKSFWKKLSPIFEEISKIFDGIYD